MEDPATLGKNADPVVDVVLGRLIVSKTADGARRIKTPDPTLVEEVAMRLGAIPPGGVWECDQDQAFRLVHELRRHSVGMPARGQVQPPTIMTLFHFETTWGRLMFRHHPWGAISIDAARCHDPDALDRHALSEGYLHSAKYDNWIMTKDQFDKLVLVHWCPAPDSNIAIPAGPTRAPNRPTVEVDGHPYVLCPGRAQPKADRDWYKAAGRWSKIASPLGEYHVFDLHDGWQGVFVNRNDLRRVLAAIGAEPCRPINSHLLPPGGVARLHEEISRNSTTD